MIIKRKNMSENNWNHFKIVPKGHNNCQLSIQAVPPNSNLPRCRIKTLRFYYNKKKTTVCKGGISVADVVLIVDDDESVRNMLYKVIRSAGLEAFTVSNGEEALEAVAGGPLT